jgi:hypothetical protein
MNEFEQRKRDVLQPIYFEVGAALVDCQSFEYGIAYLLYLSSRLGVKGLDTARAISILDDDEKRTAGQLIGMLKKHVTVSEGIEEGLATALQARNQLVHRYLIENVERLADPKEHQNLTNEIRTLRSKVRKAHKQLEPFVKAIAEILDGLSIDEFVSDAKARFMSDTRQH